MESSRVIPNPSKQSPEIGSEVARGVRDERQHWREQTLHGLTLSTFAARSSDETPHSLQLVSSDHFH